MPGSAAPGQHYHIQAAAGQEEAAETVRPNGADMLLFSPLHGVPVKPCHKTLKKVFAATRRRKSHS